MLENAKGGFYVGQTDELGRRLEEHNTANLVGTKYTHKNGPWRLVWSEAHETRSAVMVREKQIKSMKSARWIRNKLLNR